MKVIYASEKTCVIDLDRIILETFLKKCAWKKLQRKIPLTSIFPSIPNQNTPTHTGIVEFNNRRLIYFTLSSAPKFFGTEKVEVKETY